MNLKTPLLVALFVLGPALAAQSAFLTPAQLKQALKRKTFVLINVHVPYEGRIAGTDLMIPFDRIGQSTRLPKDRKASIVLYCRSGTMSAEARQTLNGMGYSNVRELQGGFNAWKAAGYPLN